MAEKILEVRNVKLSFRTPSGIVKAVRGISFDLNRGETLAIVGESGSGKSVTSRAILGISAGNCIVESGEIIFDGKDLLKISEEDFYDIRGEKISMIFQDPMSSLNPIIKIGRQLTESILLKSRSKSRIARKNFNLRLKYISKYLNLATGAENNKDIMQKNAQMIADFDKFARLHVQMEEKYNLALEALEKAEGEIGLLDFEIKRDVSNNLRSRIRHLCDLVEKSKHTYVLNDTADVETADKCCAALTEFATLGATKSCLEYFEQLQTVLEKAKKQTKPNFFAMAYYLTFVSEELPKQEVPALNKTMRATLDEKYMLNFISQLEKAVTYAFNRSLESKKQVLVQLDEAKQYFSQKNWDKKQTNEFAEKLCLSVKDSIDLLALTKHSLAYTFESSLKHEIKNYFSGCKNNSSAQAKYDRQVAKHERLTKAGKEPDWKPAPPNVIDLEVIEGNVLLILERLSESYKQLVADSDKANMHDATVSTIDLLKEYASGSAYRLSHERAKQMAIEILTEVGIPEAKKRYNQYPFQLSGGMRQRVVIAIALIVHPEILICDEPTTALDVTVQAQILELINDLKEKHNLSILFITHDLGVVANMADRIAVMYAGKIVEYGTVEEVFYDPKHPYTWALLSSMPDLDTKEKLDAIPGTPPNMIYPPKGDAFAARSKYAMQIDFEEQPPLFEVSPTHYAATWLLHPDAPKVEPPRIVTERIERAKERLEVKKQKEKRSIDDVLATTNIEETGYAFEEEEDTKKKAPSKKPAAKKTADKKPAAKKTADKKPAKKPTDKKGGSK